jgi:hypothetical protein
MTERERDERDLAMLRLHENGATLQEVAELFNVPASYVWALVKEAPDP